jgi:hypothetical protein
LLSTSFCERSKYIKSPTTSLTSHFSRGNILPKLSARSDLILFRNIEEACLFSAVVQFEKAIGLLLPADITATRVAASRNSVSLAAVIVEQGFGIVESSSESSKRALKVAPLRPDIRRKSTVDTSGSHRWRVDLVSEDVFGEGFGDS